MSETKKHPAWKNAVEKIVERFEAEGYGVIFSPDELLDWFDMKIPENGTFEAFNAFAFEKLSQMENTKTELLLEYNLALENIRGKGYMLVHPNDQVTKTAGKYMQMARRKLNQAVLRLMHVDAAQLDMDASQARLQGLARMAFIKSAMNKRKIPFGDGQKKLSV